MPKTKVVNQTGSTISLKEGTAGVYRTICRALMNGKSYTIKVDPNATFREYWCAVPPDDATQVVLSTDDCMDYEEVHIMLKADKTTYTWNAVRRSTHELVADAGDKEASYQQSAQALVAATSGPNLGVFSKFWKRLKLQ